MLKLRRIVAFEGIVSVTSLYVTFPTPSVIVSWSPETVFTLPVSSVCVMKPLRALLSTTALACTAGPWSPRRGPAWRLE